MNREGTSRIAMEAKAIIKGPLPVIMMNKNIN